MITFIKRFIEEPIGFFFKSKGKVLNINVSDYDIAMYIYISQYDILLLDSYIIL